MLIAFPVLAVTTPSPHYPQYLHTPSDTSPGNPQPRSFHQLQLHTHKSPASSSTTSPTPQQQENHTLSPISPPSHSVTRSTSMGSPYKRPRLNPSISLTYPVVDQVSIWSGAKVTRRSSGSRSSRGGLGVDLTDSPITEQVGAETGEEFQSRRLESHGARTNVSYHRTEGGVALGEDSKEGEVTLGIEFEREDKKKYAYDQEPFPVSI